MASNSGILIPANPPTNTVESTSDIRPIKPPVDVPNPWAWAFWTAGILLAAAVITFALLAWRAKQKRRLIVPPVPPHVRARQKIDAALQLIGDPRAFCIAVSDAVRVYLEERFNLRAPERTTEEFLRDLQKTAALTAQQKSSLATFLEQCDLVKFARFEPPESLLRELHESALRLVHETQYEPPAAQNTPTDMPPLPPPAQTPTTAA
ncbi:MAG TPA: hypothetical protein VNT99_01915 [Methylomirabilota bacterium]|nr:hypothetical protein [Methylomirabilota bacterium]